MIRDPSDGSVREPSDRRAENHSAAHGAQMPAPEPGMTGNTPVIDTTTSGLQSGSSKPENLARLGKSREWLKDYFHRKTEGT